MLYRCVLAVISSLTLILFYVTQYICVTLTRQLCLLKAVLSIYKLVKKIRDTAPLIEVVFLAYARYLNSLSLLRKMRYYCEKAGE